MTEVALARKHCARSIKNASPFQPSVGMRRAPTLSAKAA